MIKAQLQTISKLDLGVKWINVSFRRSTKEKKMNYKHLQTISKLDL